MTEWLIPHLEWAAESAKNWGPLLVLFFMTIESSFIPFPSEAVMIPAGFLAARGEFFPAGTMWPAAAVAVACGVIGSLLGAYINYFLALRLGRPFLHRWGKYVLLPPHKLERAEQVFLEYGDITTFVCRLIPVIRQLISLPAGVARMPFRRFSILTGAGAGFWVLLLTAVGFTLGHGTRKLSYAELVSQGTAMVRANLPWILLGCAVLVIGYVWVHRRVMRRQPSARQADADGGETGDR